MKTKDALAALGALAQESRLAIFRYLVEIGPDGSPVGRIAASLDLPAATLSFHLKELSHAELLVSRQDGRFIWYAANFDAMNGLIAYLTDNCCAGQSGACVATCAPKQTKNRRRVAA